MAEADQLTLNPSVAPARILAGHPQHEVKVAWSCDQEVVEAFSAQGADEALCDRVRPRCPDRGADDPDAGAGEDGVEGGGELGVPVADQEPEPIGVRSPRSISRLRACWVIQSPVGWAVIPARCTRRRSCSITTRM